MMAYTDRHFRYIMRLFTKRSLLYTEMVVGSTITHNLKGDYLNRILEFDPVEHPIAVQLGGDEPETLAVAARVCEDFGYDEINLNVGCPSDRVQKGRFGACLMKEPERVADVVAAMRNSVSIPVTVKHRIGVDDQDDYEHLHRFVDIVSKAGCDVFIAHARKAWLKGLSPAQNRSIPPLKYDFIYRLKQDYPHLNIQINGGIMDVPQVLHHLKYVDGAMVGRAAYHQPQLFERADSEVFGEPESRPLSAHEVLEAVNAYTHRRMALGDKVSFVTKHLVGLFKNQPGSRRWRQRISKLIQSKSTNFDLAEIYRECFGVEPVSSVS